MRARLFFMYSVCVVGCRGASAKVAEVVTLPTPREGSPPRVPEPTRGTSSRRYEGEPEGYRFYATAPWRPLHPLESTMGDVLRVLGEPSEKVDLADYSNPYPGDDRARQPVFTYPIDEDWYFLVYLVKSSYETARIFPSELGDRLYSIEYIPKKQRRFPREILPIGFKKAHVVGADAAWDTLTDGSGLAFEIYTKRTRGGHEPGDLNRVVYGPSDEVAEPLKRHK